METEFFVSQITRFFEKQHLFAIVEAEFADSAIGFPPVKMRLEVLMTKDWLDRSVLDVSDGAIAKARQMLNFAFIESDLRAYSG